MAQIENNEALLSDGVAFLVRKLIAFRKLVSPLFLRDDLYSYCDDLQSITRVIRRGGIYLCIVNRFSSMMMLVLVNPFVYAIV